MQREMVCLPRTLTASSRIRQGIMDRNTEGPGVSWLRPCSDSSRTPGVITADAYSALPEDRDWMALDCHRRSRSARAT